MITQIGDDNLLMAYVHIAHDVKVGSHTVLANAVTFGGHVTVGDWAIIGASTGVHQFCRVGKHAIIGGYSAITRDVLPYSNTVTSREAKASGRELHRHEAARIAADVDAVHKAFDCSSIKLNTTQAGKSRSRWSRPTK